MGNTIEVPDCVFCKIMNGEIPATFVLEEKDCAAFLDNRPLFPGHVLLMTREHHETLPDLPHELIEPLFAKAKALAIAVEQALDAHGTFIAINNRISQSVPHLHVHVVPRRPKDGLRGFFWPRKEYAEGEAEEVAAKIRQAIQRRSGDAS